MLRRNQRVGILVCIAAYCAVMVAMGLHKGVSTQEAEILAASRMLCLAGVVAFCLPAIQTVRLNDKLVGVLGTTVVATLLFALDAVMLIAVLFSGADDAHWTPWMSVPFSLTFYGAFALIPLSIGAALEGTRFAKPLWRKSRTSENLMEWKQRDQSK